MVPRRKSDSPARRARRDAPRDRRDAPGHQGDAPRDRRDAPGHQGDAARDRRDAPRHQGDAARDRRDAPGHQGDAPKYPGHAPGTTARGVRGATGATRELVLDFVRSRLAEGEPPTVREVQQALGLSAIESARGHLERLVRDGRLTKTEGVARGYRLAESERGGATKLANAPRSPSTPSSESMLAPGSVVRVPIVGRVAAGLLSEAIEDADGHVSVDLGGDSPTPAARAAARSRTLFALRVRGESMRDAAILHGDVVLVERTHEVHDGEIVVAQVDGEATVKTLRRRGGAPGVVELVPANPDFETLRFAPSAPGASGAPLEILGRVLEVRRYLKPARAPRPMKPARERH